MKAAKNNKLHGSDDEGDEAPPLRNRDSISSVVSSQVTHDKKDRPMSQYEIEKAELESAQVIPDSEVSPAAFIFSPTDEEQQQILFEEK